MTDYGFKKYEKVHRFDHQDEVEGILKGECYIFEKLDGANASVWCEPAPDGFWICGASRNKPVFRFFAADPNLATVHDEFRGFFNYVSTNNELITLLLAHPILRLYGEWLVKHTVVYPSEFLQKFYIFDIENREVNLMWTYPQYKNLVSAYEVPYLKPFDVITDPTMDDLEKFIGNTDYGAIPHGEGVVVKNYGFVNKYGRRPYAKLVSKEFKEMNAKVFGGPIPRDAVEMKIASVYCTLERVVKILGKIKDAKGGEEANIKDMGRLLGTIYNDIITEEIWTILKKFKNPIIDFRKLQKEITDLARNHFLGILQGGMK